VNRIEIICDKLNCDKEDYFPTTYCDISNCKADYCTIYYFTHGQCAAFAIALHDLFKYPLSILFKNSSPCIHAFCRDLYDNKVIDARGISSIGYILHNVYHDNYDTNDIKPTTREQLKIIGKGEGVSDLMIEKAKSFIEKNVDVYKI
jgi:hypothetical protein